jgi:hypothetical protein
MPAVAPPSVPSTPSDSPLATLFASVLDRFDQAVRRQILTQPAAKAFALSSYADAESSGESQVFERALVRAQDPAVQKMIRVHQADEIRHAKLLDDRRVELGLPLREVPPELKIMERLSEAAGGLLDLAMDTDEDVARVYALLYVVEERALDEFARQQRALADVGDHVSAALFRQIGDDERRHLRYCEAIGRRYAGDEGFAWMLGEMRAIERRVYGKQTRDWLWHLLRQGWLTLPWSLGSLARGVLSLGDRLHLPAPAPVL